MATESSARWPRGRSQWSGMMGEGEVDGSRTVEGLRGRLLAERAASKAAREEAELLGKRMNELEMLLAVEIESRNRAEERLKRILKRLESLKILDVSSGKSGAPEASGSASSARSPGLREQEDGKNRSQRDKSTRSDADGKAEENGDLLTRKHRGDESSDATPPRHGSTDPSVSRGENQVPARGSQSHSESIPSRERDQRVRRLLLQACRQWRAQR